MLAGRFTTKKQRLVIYKDMLTLLILRKEENTRPASLCALIWALKSNHWEIGYFPELMKYKPEEYVHGVFWFSPGDYDIRIKVLNEIIAKMSEKKPSFKERVQKYISWVNLD